MITYQESNNMVEAFIALNMLRHLNDYYPDFEFWFVNKVIPGMVTGKDIMIVAKEHEQIIGVSFVKKTEQEKKLRCVRVLPEYQNKGLGIHLIEKSLKVLDSDKPSCSVSEEMFHDFSRPFINLFNFDLSHVSKGTYRKNKLEYFFNTPAQDLSSSSIIFNTY